MKEYFGNGTTVKLRDILNYYSPKKIFLVTGKLSYETSGARDVIEPTFGMDRSVLCVLMESNTEEEINGKTRVVLKIKPKLAPYKAAVFPLLANKPELVEKARKIYLDLKQDFMIAWDERGNIGKRYASQDEIGTPYCLTVDFQTLEDEMVTVRDRDSATQERVKIDDLKHFLDQKINAQKHS